MVARGPQTGQGGVLRLRPPGACRASRTAPSRRRRAWNGELGLYVLDWDNVRASDDPHAFALEFARSAFQHACLVCGWDEKLAASGLGAPPPVA